MRPILIALVFSLFNCSNKKETSDTTKLSGAQTYLNNLLDNLKNEYSTQSSAQTKKRTLDKYQERLQTYLMHNYIDTIRVTVDEVIKDGWMVTTRLHYGRVEFKHSLIFNEHMTPRVDSVYKFMLGLKQGSTVTANFSFAGSSQVNDPNDKTVPTFRIIAFPIPLEFTGE